MAMTQCDMAFIGFTTRPTQLVTPGPGRICATSSVSSRWLRDMCQTDVGSAYVGKARNAMLGEGSMLPAGCLAGGILRLPPVRCVGAWRYVSTYAFSSNWHSCWPGLDGVRAFMS